MVTRITLSLDPVDVDLLDRLSALTGSNRSEQMRQFMAEYRPMLRQTVELLETALKQRDALLRVVGEAGDAGLGELLPELERVQNVVLGSMARLEGRLAAEQAREDSDPRPSNHGGHTPTPSPEETTE